MIKQLNTLNDNIENDGILMQYIEFKKSASPFNKEVADILKTSLKDTALPMEVNSSPDLNHISKVVTKTFSPELAKKMEEDLLNLKLELLKAISAMLLTQRMLS